MLKDFTLSLELDPKTNETVQTSAVFWSHDVNTAKIYIELLRKGTPIILNKDVTVRVMMLFDDENKSEHIYTAKIEDELKGLVSITLEESMRMYVGQVTCGVYVDYQNEEKTDNGYFTFGMRRSLIDKDMPELQKLYVSDFEKALEKFEEIEKKIEQNDVVTYPELKKYTYDKATIDGKVKDLEKSKVDKSLYEREMKEKASLKELNNIDNTSRKKDEEIYLHDLSDEVKRAMTGDTNINMWVADRSITPAKTDFIHSENLFNKSWVIDNKYVAYDDGTLRENNEYAVTNRIYNLSQGLSLSFSGQTAFFDYKNNYISGINSSGSGTINIIKPEDIPQNAVYALSSIKKSLVDLNKIMINSGTSLKPFSSFSYKLEESLIPDFSGKEKIREKTITSKELDIMEAKNKADISNFEDNYYLQYTNGVPAPNNRYGYSKILIDVEPGQVWSMSQDVQLAFYDVNGHFVTGITGKGTTEARTFSVPKNNQIRKMGLNFLKETSESLQLNKGETLLNYSDPKKETIKIEYIAEDYELKNSNLLIPKNVYASTGSQLEIYNKNIVQNDYRKYNFWYKTATFKQYEEKMSLKNSGTGYYPVVVETYSNYELFKKAGFQVVIRPMRTSKIKIMLLGDSTVRDNGKGTITKEIKSIMGNNVGLIGKMGDSSNAFEGRGGWTIEKYRTDSIYFDGVTTHPNYFYDDSKQDFSISKYLERTNQEKPDVIILQSGINEMFSVKDDNTMSNQIQKTIDNYKYVLNDIKSNGIRAAVSLTIPPNSSQQKFGERDDNQTQWRYERNNKKLVAAMIESFNDHYDLIPNNLIIDGDSDISDAIHLHEHGSKKIANQYVAYLNSI